MYLTLTVVISFAYVANCLASVIVTLPDDTYS